MKKWLIKRMFRWVEKRLDDLDDADKIAILEWALKWVIVNLQVFNKKQLRHLKSVLTWYNATKGEWKEEGTVEPSP